VIQLRGTTHPTYQDKGKTVRNGTLRTIWRESDEIRNEGVWFGYQPKQVYATSVLPGMRKGPHLHHKRAGLFTCLVGQVLVVTKTPSGHYEEAELSAGTNSSIFVPAGTPAMIINKSDKEALLLNMPSQMYDPTDEFTADFSDYEG